MKENREVCVYERGGSLFIRWFSQTEAGLWTAEGPCTMLPSSSEPAEIGQAARGALAHSGKIIPHPTEWKSVDKDNPILELTGIKRWSTFRRGARAVCVSLREGKLEVMPTENEGSQGFDYLVEDAICLSPEASAEVLGTAINEALGRCK